MLKMLGSQNKISSPNPIQGEAKKNICAKLISSIRPWDWLHFLLFPIAGWFFSQNRDINSLINALVSCSLLLAYAYSHNNFHSHRIKQNEWYHRIMFIAAAASIFILPAAAKIAAIIFLIIVTSYSSPPRFKGYPGMSVACNGLGFGVLVFLAVDTPCINVWLLFAMTTLWVSSCQLIHEDAHREHDSRRGDKTTAIIIGSQSSRKLAIWLLVLACVSALFITPVMGAALSVYTLTFAVLVRKLDAQTLRKTMRYMGFLWAAATGVYLYLNTGLN